jgi:hypothetical protein
MSFNQTLTLRQPLFRKPLWAGLQQATLLVEDAEASLAREHQNLVVRVTGAYLEVLLASDQLEVVLAQRRATETQLDAARKAVAAGAGTRTDVYEAVARLDLVLAQELEAREQLVSLTVVGVAVVETRMTRLVLVRLAVRVRLLLTTRLLSLWMQQRLQHLQARLRLPQVRCLALALQLQFNPT